MRAGWKKPIVTTAVLSLCVFLLIAPAAAQPPHLTGELSVDLPRGSLAGNMCLFGLPEKGSIHFSLNKGLNIAAVTMPSGEVLPYDGYFDPKGIGDGLEYAVDTKGTGTFCVRYVGRYPVYWRPTNTFDFKGMIAFNGRTLRATEQSQWYPMWVDDMAGTPTASVTYDIRITCHACRALYVNGDSVKPGPTARFSSTVPRPLLLYVGEFKSRTMEGLAFIDGKISPSGARTIRAAVKGIKDFYREFMGAEPVDTAVFLTYASVDSARPRGKNTLTFAVWPTIAFDGQVDFDDFVEDPGGQPRLNDVFWHTLAHETAHYYFGTRVAPKGSYRWFYLESTAEYLGLKALRHAHGESELRQWEQKYFKRVLQQTNARRLDRLGPEEGSSEDRYYYWPLLLLALDQRIGDARMRQTFSAFLNAPPGTVLDYGFFRQAALGAGVSDEQWQEFERACVFPGPKNSCLKELVGATD